MNGIDKNILTLKILENLTIKMHPHLGSDNHTHELIKILYRDKSKLTNRDYFDLGKYYDRMISIVEKTYDREDREAYLKAVLDLKDKCYGSYRLSSLNKLT